MQVNSINRQNFNGSLIMPAGMQSRLEKGIFKVLNHETKEFSDFSELIKKLYSSSGTNIKIFAKNGIENPVKDADFDVFVENMTQYSQKKIETGVTLAERFLNALYEATKSL